MTTQHTPGPWYKMEGGMSIKGDIPNLIQIYAPNDDLEMICQVWKDGHLIHRTQDHKANARLIAAAPELLEALTALLTCTELNMDDMEQETRELIDQAQAVILKATGDKVGTEGGTYTPGELTAEDFERMAQKMNEQQGNTQWRGI